MFKLEFEPRETNFLAHFKEQRYVLILPVVLLIAEKFDFPKQLYKK